MTVPASARPPIALAILLALPAAAHAARPAPVEEGTARGPYRVPPAASAITINGVLDEPAWAAALRVELAYEFDPGNNIPAAVRTECFVTHDERALYVAFRAHDPDPSQIRAHVTDRDSAERDDTVGFIIDPFNDERRGFQMFVNALGVQMDASFNDVSQGEFGEGGVEDETWDAIWTAAARITPEGYEAEIAVPYTSLRFPRAPGAQTWGFLPLRSYPRSSRHQLGLVPIDRNRSCLICQSAKLIGFEGISPGRNLEFYPTVTAGRTDDRDDYAGAPLDHGGLSVSPGLSARWGMTPNLSLNAALNPDFSQVEADVAQLTINTRFALFYPEKRPFFLEGADFFSTPLNVIYTRTVDDPAWGLKVTGKEGGHAIGAAFGRDENTGFLVPSNQESGDTTLDLNNDVAVLRYRRDVGRSSTLGVMLTDREGEGYHNRLAGADGFLRLGSVDTIRFQALASDTRYPAALLSDPDVSDLVRPEQTTDDFSGVAWLLHYGHTSRRWFWSATYEDLGRDFRADTGFIPRVDTRRVEAALERIFWGDGRRWFNRLGFGTWNYRIEDHDGLLTDQEIGVHLFFNGPLQSRMFARVESRREYFDGVTYDQTVGMIWGGFQPAGSFSFELRARHGDAIDYDNSRAGRVLNLRPEFVFNFGRHLRLRLEHTFERLTVDGGRLYDDHLLEMRLVHQFTLRTFARVIAQYERIHRDPSLYLDPVDEVSKDTLVQLLFSYKVNPQTLVYLGYTAGRATEDYGTLTLYDRTLFFKIGYAWTL